mgnify:CR=1 FL=1
MFRHFSDQPLRFQRSSRLRVDRVRVEGLAQVAEARRREHELGEGHVRPRRRPRAARNPRDTPHLPQPRREYPRGHRRALRLVGSGQVGRA